MVIALVLMSVFNNSVRGVRERSRSNYSQFIADVKQGRVQKVVIEGRNIQGVLQTGERFGTYTAGDGQPRVNRRFARERRGHRRATAPSSSRC